MPVRTVVERGPKGKRAVAFAIDWPGWSRGGLTAEAAIETLDGYRPRYRAIASLAGLGPEFDAAGALEVVEDHAGTGSTDFWGISFAASRFEFGPVLSAEFERRLSLLEAAWCFFDQVAARTSPVLRKGPRGGGRERDEIVRHTFGAEVGQFARKVGVRTPVGAIFEPERLHEHREHFLAALRDYNAEGRKAGISWTVPFLLRHTAFHTLDHAWEMEDRDLADVPLR